MLTLNKKTGYGLIALTHLARLDNGDVASAREIAAQSGAPAALLSNALKDLAAEGLVASIRGARGGYRLCAPPEEIDFERIIVALEGPVRLAECGDAADDPPADRRCPVPWPCPITKPLQDVQGHLRRFLRGVTLADMVASSEDTGR
ncbi:MAG: RrF2 family transcriptional regulator [Phycisphaerae bacterium]